ncbi:MAG: hypothetical protein UR94_C0001G0009 [Parcubacteria group bacterium GW2011_GWA2_36_10]|nr:MAG: hypothetical protein UR94_C0001G0009 [Parcubacteria group bacterium GW2011_GWA2_36_10]
MIQKYIKDYHLRRVYSKNGRQPFYKLASKYLPHDKGSIVIDVGCGIAEFAEEFDLAKMYDNLFLLEGNKVTVDYLKNKFKNVLEYKIPDKLPFENNTVAFIHLSHIVEHLEQQELYDFLQEVDRVLMNGGVLVVSTPLMWNGFYDDLSHIKPYNDPVFINYLVAKSEDRSRKVISHSYKVLDLVYRYRSLPVKGGWSSKYLLVDILMQILKRVVSVLGFRYQIKNGYTLVLKK